MASLAVVNAVVAKLAAAWTTTPIIGPGLETEAPSDGSAFISLQFPVSNVERPSVATRSYRESGAFRIVVSSERPDGYEAALTQATTLAAAFRDITFDEVRCLVPTIGPIDGGNDDGNYFVVSIVVPYWTTFRD